MKFFVISSVIFGGFFQDEQTMLMLVQVTVMTSAIGFAKNFGIKRLLQKRVSQLLNTLRAEGIAYITATHDVNNPRSGGVMKRLGMRYQYSYEE